MKLKESLLFEIFNAQTQTHKYSKSFLNLKTLMKLEHEDEFSFGEDIINNFKLISTKYYSLINDIPLTIIEQYYLRNAGNLNKPLFIEYEHKQIIDKKVIDIYIILEEFYNDIFLLASQIGNLYNLEIKVNVKSNSKTDNYL